jgi:hypothetical protein
MTRPVANPTLLFFFSFACFNFDRIPATTSIVGRMRAPRPKKPGMAQCPPERAVVRPVSGLTYSDPPVLREVPSRRRLYIYIHPPGPPGDGRRVPAAPEGIDSCVFCGGRRCPLMAAEEEESAYVAISPILGPQIGHGHRRTYPRDVGGSTPGAIPNAPSRHVAGVHRHLIYRRGFIRRATSATSIRGVSIDNFF